MENNYCIYKFTNPKGFVYIGQSKNIKKRLIAYKYPNSIKLQVHISNSILKYGLENHSIEILYENLSKEEANVLEISQIARYKSLAISLNISDGGHLVSRTRHVAIIQCDLKGNLLNQFDSIIEASLFNGISNTSISNVIQNKTGYLKGFLWITKKDWDNGIKPIWKAEKNGRICIKREVYQFDLSSNFIAKYSSPHAARNALNLKPRSLNNLSILPFTKSGEWLFSYSSEIPLYKNHRMKKIIQLDNFNNIINEFESGEEAVKVLKMSEATLYKLLKGEKSEKFNNIILKQTINE